MEQHNKSWSLYVFSFANAIRSYTIDQLIRLGSFTVQNSEILHVDSIDLPVVNQTPENP